MSLTEIPADFGTYFGISTDAASVLLSIVFIFALLLPVMYLGQRQSGNHTMVYTMVIFLTSALLIGIGWLPYWIMIVEICLCAFAVAFLGSKMFGG